MVCLWQYINKSVVGVPGAGTHSELKKKLNLFILSVVRLTILDERNQIMYVHFALYCD